MRVQQVPKHDHFHTDRNRCFEGEGIRFQPLFERDIDHRQSGMGIDRCSPVTGKVFCRAANLAPPGTTDNRGDLFADDIRVAAECPANHRAVR